MTVLRLGVIGLGNMGSVHARRVQAGEVPACRLTAVADRRPALVEALTTQDSAVAGFADGSALIQSGDVDAVLIATPHYSHTALGVEALEAGLHVLVEKPISVHKADCETLLAAHTRAPDRVFAAMFQMRVDPAFRTLKALLDAGELGAVQRISWIITNWYRTQSYYDSGGWRATWGGEGGGVLLNQCPHQLDLYQWLFGMPERVRAFCQLGRFHDIEVEDAVTAYLEHPGGATGVFVTTTGEAPGTQRLEIAGECGRLVLEDGRLHFTRTTQSTTEHLRTARGGFEQPGVWHIDIPIEGVNEAHLGILKNFTRACLDGAALCAPAAEGIHSVELANAMLYSSALEQTLALPLDAVAYSAWLEKKRAHSRYDPSADGAEDRAPEDLSGSYNR